MSSLNIKMLPTIFVKWLIRCLHAVFCLIFPVNNRKVTFASYRSEKLEGNLYYIYRELEKSEDDYRFVFMFKKYYKSLSGKIHYFFHMLKGCYELATSKYFFVDDFYFPIYVINPRKETKIIQLWHAGGAFKKFGYSTIGKSFGPSPEYIKHVRVHSNYTHVYVSSKTVIPCYAEAFDMPEENIYPLGVPRTDFFFNAREMDKAKKKFYDRFPELKNKKVILYAPTYRGNSHDQKGTENDLDISALRESTGDHYVLLIHLHPYMRGKFVIDEKDRNFAYHINGGFSTEELLAITDLLITDYSSIIFDFSLLCRPMAFLATDLNEYREERDFYFHYETILPGPLFTDTESLAGWINKGDFDIKKIIQFRNKFFDFLDGKSSQRIINHLLEKQNEEWSALSKGINF